MSSTDLTSDSASPSPPPKPGEMKLEVIPLPVSDVDRAKEFYTGLGWRLDADLNFGDVRGVSEPFHREDDGNIAPGPHPERRSYFTYATFSDPDGNSWLLQEITERLPGR